MRSTIVLLAGFAITVAAPAVALQQADVRAELITRGAPQGFADRVATIVAAAGEAGLPTAPLSSKALEGWAKRGRVPPERVLVVLGDLANRLEAGRDITVEAGLDPPPGSVVAAAAEALGRGMTAEDVAAILDAAPTRDVAATGLTVAASLAAQGLDRAAAVRAVREASGEGRPPEEVLEFPSAVANLLAQGVPMADVARRILEGGGLPLPSTPGVGGGRPSTVPATKGLPPGRGRRPINP